MVRFAVPLLLLLTGIAVGVPSMQDAAAAGDRVGKDAIDKASLCAIGRKPPCSIKLAIARGLFPTGLQPRFAAGAKCRGIDEHYAIDYTYKRNHESYHGGIDMPAPFGTPIVAAAAGTVVGVYAGEGSYRGRELILRHTPEDTGIPLWIYTVYGHFNKAPKFAVGDRVRMGEVLGPTGNSGTSGAHKGGGRGSGRRGGGERAGATGGMFAGERGGGSGGRRGGHHSRRPAIHFAIYFSTSPKYAALPRIVIPADAHWMDPVALYRATLPFDSATMKALPAKAKQVPIPYMLADGTAHPAGTKLIWPYTCTRR
jgi:Peptidase family M23